MSKKRQAVADEGLEQIDAGLAEIDAWGTWFLEAHTQRLRDLNLPPDQHARDLELVVRTAEAVVARMRSDYLARRTP